MNHSKKNLSLRSFETGNLSADNFKKYSTSTGRHLSPRYGQVILVSGYPVLTAVDWSQHWCAISFLLGSQTTVASKCESKHWLPCGEDGRTGVRSRDYQIFWDGKIYLAMGLRPRARFARAWSSAIKASTTIQYQQRSLSIPLPCIPGSPLCPVMALRRHLRLNPGP